MKKLLTFGAGALLAAALALPVHAEESVPYGPIILQHSQKRVIFKHGVHITQLCTGCHATVPQHFPPLAVDTKQQCVVCHHLIADEPAPTYQCSASGCHDEFSPKDKSVNSYFRIVHARNVEEDKTTCLKCHYEVIKTRPEKKQELTACVGSACHPKK